ncbi:ABC transporter ATP-binding protein [Slackia exigua]|uniref:ABC transporter ATP-binding protein n=1 Tax=Slackia exigua TaxID=84109 RepID=UPI0020042113|nr:ABC transporter ATP-binding protein [Slackia exigua]MCK6139279.1 ABC transporter ATP-binding protein [Slackia exigua]
MIRLEGIRFAYEGGGAVLEGVDLDVAKGETVLLLGGSGSGKTSLTRVINGLIPSFFAGSFSGEARIGGSMTGDMDMTELSSRVGSVFQNPRNQFFTLDVASELAFGLENRGMPPADIRRRMDRALSDLRLEHLRDCDVLRLSGGQMQSVAIASAYALDPDIFVMDEPSANLDVKGTEELRRLLVRLKDAGKTIVISEHRLYFMKGLVDKAVYLDGGRVAHEWNGDELYGMDERRRISLGLRALSLHPPRPSGERPDENGNRLRLEGLAVGYRKELLERIDLTIHAGEVVGILGENGTGKSCLLSTIAGLRRELGGRILFNDECLRRKRRQRACAMVMQDPGYQFFMEDVETELFLGRTHEKAAEGERVLREMGLWKKRGSNPLALSGGEKQRLAIAISLVDRKDIILLDEPSSGLDLRSLQALERAISKMRSLGKIVLITSHDNELLSATCTRMLTVENGIMTEMQSERNVVHEHESDR